jgi:hypothetical protein
MSFPINAAQQNESDSTLLPSEPVIATLSAEDGQFRLTASRLIFTGGRETVSLYAVARLRDVTGVEIRRRPRESRSAWWGGIGLLAAVGVWEVSSNATVGAVAAAVVAFISAALLADYWFRPAGTVLAFNTPGSAVQGLISTSGIDAAKQFVTEFEQVRAYSARAGSFGPTAGYGSF